MKLRAQSTIEFTFAMIVIVLLMFCMVKVFRWVGLDLADRRFQQDATLTANPPSGSGPEVQLDPNFYTAQPLSAEYHGNITNGKENQ
jgi:hypothetical protein